MTFYLKDVPLSGQEEIGPTMLWQWSTTMMYGRNSVVRIFALTHLLHRLDLSAVTYGVNDDFHILKADIK